MTETQTGPLPPSANGFHMIRRAPCAALYGIVMDYVGYRESRPGHFRHFEPASLVVPLVISFGEPFSIALGRAPRDDDRIATFTAGLSNSHVVIDSFGAAHCLQVNFTPQGAWRFLSLPMHELTDRMVALEDIWGSRSFLISERLAEARDWDSRFDLVEDLILSRVRRAPSVSPAAWLAYERLVATAGNERIGTIARKLDCSRKHLAEKFHTEIGLRPKAVARIARFNRALSLVRAGGDLLADVAAACGYADQAHFGREFRGLAGETPAAWRSATA